MLFPANADTLDGHWHPASPKAPEHRPAAVTVGRHNSLADSNHDQQPVEHVARDGETRQKSVKKLRVHDSA
jgi:hypothetical protein